MKKFLAAVVALLTFVTVIVAAPSVAQAQQGLPEIEDQWNRVGDTINWTANWLDGAEVVGLPAGLSYDNTAITGVTSVRGRWPVEVRLPQGTSFFQWLVTDGAPEGEVAEHFEVDPREVSPRPEEGMDGVVWIQRNNDTTASLDVTVWDMQQVGPWMYVGGEFQEVIEQGPNGSDGPRTRQPHLARFSVDTGEWDPSFRPALDGNVHALEISPRGLLLVGGEFTNIDGVADTQGLAAINPRTGQVDTSFQASVDRPFYPEGRAIVRELEVVGTLLYIGGNFSHVDGPGDTRVRVNKVARVGANFGTIDATWAPVVSGGSVWGIGIDQDRGRVHLSGRFTSVNGSTDQSLFATVSSETGATIEGLQPRVVNNQFQLDAYDVEYFNDEVIIAGSQHTLARHDADTHQLLSWSFTGNQCTTVFCWSSAGAGGDFQFVEKIGDYVFGGCHCNDSFNRFDQPNHYNSVSNQRTEHRVVIGYDSTGAPVDTVFDIGGNIDGGWTVATADNGCIWFGGDIIDGGFYEPGGRVFARGFARFCSPPDEEAPSTPTNLVATDRGDGDVELNWEASTDDTAVDGYLVFRDGGYLGFADDVTTYVDVPPLPGVEYTYWVRAVDTSDNESENSASALITPGGEDLEPPTIPQNVAATVAADSSVELTWDASTDNVLVTGYQVFRNGGYLGFANDVTSYVDDSPVLPGVDYSYTVRAIDINENRSEPSEAVVVRPAGDDVEPPSVPQNVAATVAADGSVEVNWEASTDNVAVTGYLVYRDGAYLGFANNVTTYVDNPPIVPGVAYSYTVRAVDPAENRSDQSDPAVANPGGEDLEAPSIPANAVAAVVDTTVEVNWEASTDNVAVQTYRIFRNGSYLDFVAGDTTTFVDDTAAIAVEYTYTVRAVDAAGNESADSDPTASVAVGGIDIEPPSDPVNVVATDPGDGTVLVTWDASTDNVAVRSYLVYRDGVYMGWTPADTTSYTDTAPPVGQAVTYTIRAVDVNDNRSERSNPGATITVGGPDVEPPTVPVNLTAADAGDGTITISWDQSTDNVGIQSYLIYRDGAYLGWTPAGTTTVSDTPPLASVEYTYTVRAIDVNDNRSERTDPGATAILGGDDLEPPTIPGNIAAAELGDGTVEISWDASVDNVALQSYLVYRNGAYLGWAPAGTTTFVDTAPIDGQEVTYSARAVDVNGNRSDRTDPGATIIAGGPDVTPPPAPVNLTLINPAAGAVEIAWDPSVDDRGLRSYLIYRDGAYIGWSPADVTTFVDLTAESGFTYVYDVRAVDNADNRSDKSLPLTVDVF